MMPVVFKFVLKNYFFNAPIFEVLTYLITHETPTQYLKSICHSHHSYPFTTHTNTLFQVHASGSPSEAWVCPDCAACMTQSDRDEAHRANPRTSNIEQQTLI